MIRQLTYDRPARGWKEALPVGNGFTAAMVYGGKGREILSLNDCTLWSGYPRDYDSPESLEYLDRVRELAFAGKYQEATRMAEAHLAGDYSESFLPLGDLDLRLTGGRGLYSRSLNLDDAILTVRSGSLERECFASNPARVLVYRVTGSGFSAVLSAKSQLHSAAEAGADGLILSGNAPDHVVPNYLFRERRPIVYEQDGRGMAFALFVRPVTDGRLSCKKGRIYIKNATHLTLIAATATGFRGYDQMPDPDRAAAGRKAKELVMNAGTDVAALKAAHIDDYHALYRGQDFSLHTQSAVTTDRMLKNPSDFNALSELLYHYGKYLTIAGSRAGGQPLNLQGQWNRDIRPAWSSNYTVNINTQMNYWAASACGLQQCLEPYIRMVHEVSRRGRKTARVNYGCGGFACNHNVDLWRKTPPVKGTANYMYAPLCGVWLANEIYEHYCNGGLEAFSDTVGEIVRGAAEFGMDYLVEHDGAYVSCPSASPEAVFASGGSQCGLGCHSAFENGLIRQALANALAIERDSAVREKISGVLARLKPFEYGADGVSEWSGGLSAAEKGHRHFSPLYALYPGRVAGAYSTPELTMQMRRLFDCRQSHSKGQIGWSTAWAICLSGRFHDGASAQQNIHLLFEKALFKNLFNVHFPFIFQIDGNFGYVAGVNECLIGWEDGIVELLPALPPQWTEGEMRDVCVRGARISFAWENGRVVRVDSDRQIVLRQVHLAPDCRIGKNIQLKEGA